MPKDRFFKCEIGIECEIEMNDNELPDENLLRREILENLPTILKFNEDDLNDVAFVDGYKIKSIAISRAK